MARDFDNFPTYDTATKDPGYFSDMWSDFMATFIESLKEYMGSHGMFVPILSQEERNAIQQPKEGQLIYLSNTSLPGLPRTAQLQVWLVTADVGQWTVVV